MAAGDVFQYTFVQIADGVAFANILYIEVIDDTGTTDAEMDAFTAFANQFFPHWQAVISDDVTFDCLLSRQVLPTTAPTRLFTIGVVGSIVAQPLAMNQTLVITHRSKPYARTNQGHINMSGVPEAWAVNGRLDESNVPSFASLLTALTSVLTDSGRTYRMQHHSRKLGTYVDIELAELRPIFSKLRRRTKPLCAVS